MEALEVVAARSMSALPVEEVEAALDLYGSRHAVLVPALMITRGREIDVTVKVMPDGGRKDAFGTLGFRKVTKNRAFKMQTAKRPTTTSDPVAALRGGAPVCREARRSAKLNVTAWLDNHIQQTSVGHSETLASTDEEGASRTATTKLDDTSSALRQLSLALSSVRDASRTEADQIIRSLVATIPKIGIELKLMSDTALTLQSRVKTLQTDSSGTEPATDAALARIAALSKAKSDLIDARHVLREAQAWSTLESQVTVLLSEQRWQEAVDRVVKATDSLRLFSGSAKSNEERGALLESLTQRIHEHLAPVLAQAIATRDADTVHSTAGLLSLTRNGVAIFFQIYTNARSESLLSRWAQIASETSEKSLPAQLSSLFGDLLALLGEERVASSRLFTDPNKAVQLLTADIMARLDPPIHASIQHATRAPDLESFLTALTDAYKASEEAIRAVQAILPERTQDKSDDEPESASIPIDSSVLSSSNTDKTWLRLMLESFLPYQERLSTFEAEAMQSRLHTLQASSPSTSATISSASTQSLQVAKAALRRSTALTKTFATPSLLPSLDALLEGAMSRAKLELDSDLQRALREVQARIRSFHTNERAGQASLTYDERGDVLTSSDWDDFRRTTEKLKTCRESLAAVRALEETIAYQISELKPLVKAPGEDGPDFTSPISALATSSLNTAALHELISKSKRMLSASSWDASASASPELQLLPTARASILAIARAVQTFLHELVLSQFLPELEVYASLSIWTSSKHPSVVNEYDLAMPKFSFSPTEAMARIGEAMLNLPRLFEAYADEALLFCLNSDADRGGADKWRPTLRTGDTHRLRS
ncbi:hypothetical protein L1887_54213 [Cichorium endivia]|nr:hypothetical protein L1887_54213 [Cichorium endivia]